MARILFVALLAMCLACMLQASPMPDQPTAQQPNPLNDLDTALKGAAESVQKGYEAVVNDPTVKKMYEDAARLLAQGAEAIRQQAEKAIPKTR